MSTGAAAHQAMPARRFTKRDQLTPLFVVLWFLSDAVFFRILLLLGPTLFLQMVLGFYLARLGLLLLFPVLCIKGFKPARRLIVTYVVDLWSYVPVALLLLGSFGIPYLYHAFRASKASRKEGLPLWGHGLFFFMAGLGLLVLLSSLLQHSAFLCSVNLVGIRVPLGFLSPMLALLIVAINWHRLAIDHSVGTLIGTLLILGALTLGLGALFVVFAPLLQAGQPPASYLYFFLNPIVGATLIAAGIFAWMKQEGF